MKKILFPTDFSPAADQAFIYALKLAKKTNASITTLHCCELPTIKSSLPHTMLKVYESISLEEFENYRDHVPHLREIAEKTGLQDVPFNHIMQEGETRFNIIRIAEKENFDLIVMGTTGASGLKEIFLGSLTAEIMENAPCPVLGIPVKADFNGAIERIAFAANYQKEEIKALHWLSNWDALVGAEISCVHVDTKHTEHMTHRMDLFKTSFEGKDKLNFEVLDHTNFERALTEYLDKKEIEMLVIVIHKRNFFKELFGFSFTKSMAYHSNTPILAIPENAVDKLSPVVIDKKFGVSLY